MGYRGKLVERQRARELRAQGWTLVEIANELGVSKSSVSTWVRDVDFVPRPRNRGHPAGRKHPMRLKKEAELEHCRIEAEQWVGDLSDRDLHIFGAALYLGEGAKTERSALRMTNTSAAVMTVYMAWIRRFIDVDERRRRVRLYLHEGLDVGGASTFWSERLGVPLGQSQRPFRPPHAADRTTKHPMGCVTVVYSCLLTHRRVMALVEAIASRVDDPG